MTFAPAEHCADRILIDDWHVVADRTAIGDYPFETRLLGTGLSVRAAPGGTVGSSRRDTGGKVHAAERYGFVWACLGDPGRGIPEIAEAAEDDRYLVTGGSFAVKVSGLRAVENFLDLGHLPFVHGGILGDEPHTEVVPYQVEITEAGEVLATNCKFYQPVASPTATEGFVVDYTYKVLRPYTVMLYKSNPSQKERLDVIVLFVQPLDEESCVAHPFLCYLKHDIDEPTIRWFMQIIFGQDKPILENQFPRRLPLDPRAETPIRADQSSIYYRRWLRDNAVSYGAIPARH
jgi:phenylpropionate dioxygenase-like ring-hydroxylating dioxygenase large terminal subunit